MGRRIRRIRDGARRKTQEELWLLTQVKKYCAETKGAQLVLITGSIGFREDREALLKAELSEDLHIVTLADESSLKLLLDTGGTSD